MAGYISLLSFTEQGIQSPASASERLAEVKGLAQGLGVRVVGIWVTMGRYDAALIVDAPDEQAAAALALKLSSSGSLRTETMRAFSEEEFAELVKKVP